MKQHLCQTKCCKKNVTIVMHFVTALLPEQSEALYLGRVKGIVRVVDLGPGVEDDLGYI